MREEEIRNRLNLSNEWTIVSQGNKGKYVYYTFRHISGAESRVIISSSKFRYLEEREKVQKELERTLLESKRYYEYRYFEFSSDVGSLAIGSKEFKINIPNGYGDGSFLCRVYDEDIDLESFNKGWKFYTTIDGQCYLFDYDCLDAFERKEAIENNKAFELFGRYAIYTRRVDYEGIAGIAFVKYS